MNVCKMSTAAQTPLIALILSMATCANAKMI